MKLLFQSNSAAGVPEAACRIYMPSNPAMSPEDRDLKVTLSPTAGLLGEAEKSAIAPTVTVCLAVLDAPRESMTVRRTRYVPGLTKTALTVSLSGAG